jgi:hypothetical protein
MTKKAEEKNESEQSTVHSTKNFDRVHEEAESKRIQLEEKYKCKVKMAILAMPGSEEPCVVYFKAATTYTKMQSMDLAYQSFSKASATLFEATVIREDSDARVFVQNDDNDMYYLGALDFCLNAITVARDVLKKN